MQLRCLFKSELGACLLNKDSILKSIFWQNECRSGMRKWRRVRTCYRLLLHYPPYHPADTVALQPYLQALSCPCLGGNSCLSQTLASSSVNSSPLLLASYRGCLSCPPTCLAFWLIVSSWLWEMHLSEPLPCVHLVCWSTISFLLVITVCLPGAYRYL